MLRLNEKHTRVKLMTIHGFAMLALGLSLFYYSLTDDDTFLGSISS